MTKEQREKTARQLTYLLGCAVRKETPEAGRLSDADVDYILDLASHHMLAAAASMALQNAGIKNARTLHSEIPQKNDRVPIRVGRNQETSGSGGYLVYAPEGHLMEGALSGRNHA